MQIDDGLSAVEAGLVRLGYPANLLLRGYRFSNLSDAAGGGGFDAIDLAAFAVNPPSYSSACLGVVRAPSSGVTAKALVAYRYLGAPRLLVVSESETQVWAMPAEGLPTLVETLSNGRSAAALEKTIGKRADWEPRTVLRGKSVRPAPGSGLPDYYGAGLLPAIENEVQTRLDALLMDAVSASEQVYKNRHKTDPDADFYAGFFRLIFRFVAAKMLGDRGVRPEVDWTSSDAAAVIAEVNRFYFSTEDARTFVGVPASEADVANAAWDRIRRGLRFDNLSVEALANVYENTFVDTDSRRDYGTHATPREVAEFVLRHLPVEELPREKRTIFEPFAGAAPFLVAGLARLRALLPADLDDTDRHHYFVRMLRCMEFDTFACEVAWYSLILADYPNPNGWTVTQGDIFGAETQEFERLRQDASIVLCNPPYESFTAAERADYGVENGVNKAVRSLNLVLQKPPAMLGFVLPRVAINGQSYRTAHETLNKTYGHVDLLELPEGIFKKSKAATVLLLAYGKAGPDGAVRRFAQVRRAEYPTLLENNEVKWSSLNAAGASVDSVLAELSEGRRLEQIAETFRGIEYHSHVTEAERSLETQHPDFKPGLLQVKGQMRPYALPPHLHINASPKTLRRGAKRSWDGFKVIVNRGRVSGGNWVCAAMVDRRSLVCTQQFYGVWPRDDSTSLEVIAAVMNGPVANTWIKRHSTGHDNQLRHVETVPMPSLSKAAAELIASYVRQYSEAVAKIDAAADSGSSLDRPSLVTKRDDLMLRIDVAVLTGYELDAETEAELLSRFEGHRRPGTDLAGYPADRWQAAKAAWASDLRKAKP